MAAIKREQVATGTVPRSRPYDAPIITADAVARAQREAQRARARVMVRSAFDEAIARCAKGAQP
jgi:hypothetical protein